MPPRKRARVGTRTTPLPKTPPTKPASPKAESPPTAPSTAAAGTSSASALTESLANMNTDPWTDEEETLLFKSLVRWKPTGKHKHFRMLAIFENFRSNGFGGSARREPAEHVRIPAIWAKLRSLYDLDALDEREDAHAENLAAERTSTGDEDGDEEMGSDAEDGDGEAPFVDFELPEAPDDPELDFSELMWVRRLQKEGSPEIEEGLSATRSLPGVVLTAGKDAASEEEDEDNEGGDNDQVDEEEEEEDEEGDDDEEEEDNEAEDGEDEGDGAEDDEEAEEEVEEAPKAAPKAARPAPKRGARRVGKAAPPPQSKATRRGGRRK
jgi:MRG-binding protein